MPKSRRGDGVAVLIVSVIVLLTWGMSGASNITSQAVVCPTTSAYELNWQLIPITTMTVDGCTTTFFSTETLSSTQPSVPGLHGFPGFPLESVLIGLTIGFVYLVLRRKQE